MDLDQARPLQCSSVPPSSTLFIGAFGIHPPSIAAPYNQGANIRVFRGGRDKESADGLLQAIGTCLHHKVNISVVFLLVSGDKGFLKSCRDMWSLDGRETQDYDPQQHLQFRDMYKCHLVVSSVQEKVRKRNEELQESATKRRKLEEKRTDPPQPPKESTLEPPPPESKLVQSPPDASSTAGFFPVEENSTLPIVSTDPPEKTVSSRLKTAKALWEMGEISEEEYKSIKQRILDSV